MGNRVRTPHGASDWGAEVQRVLHEGMTTRGVDSGQTMVVGSNTNPPTSQLNLSRRYVNMSP